MVSTRAFPSAGKHAGIAVIFLKIPFLDPTPAANQHSISLLPLVAEILKNSQFLPSPVPLFPFSHESGLSAFGCHCFTSRSLLALSQWPSCLASQQSLLPPPDTLSPLGFQDTTFHGFLPLHWSHLVSPLLLFQPEKVRVPQGSGWRPLSFSIYTLALDDLSHSHSLK